MCGFLAFIRDPSHHSGHRVAIDDALSLLHHRGPDDTAVADIDDGAAVMGFKRLAIIDQLGSRQPLSYPPDGPDAGRCVVVFNGEIYNFETLREQLRREHGASFATTGDAEVLRTELKLPPGAPPRSTRCGRRCAASSRSPSSTGRSLVFRPPCGYGCAANLGNGPTRSSPTRQPDTCSI